MNKEHFENAGSSDRLSGAAGESFASVSDKVREAGEEAKRAAVDTASTITDTVKELLGSQIRASATMVGQFASSVRLAADDLQQPSPKLSKVLRGFAQTLDNYGQDLQAQTLEQLARSASDFTRRKPALVFGIAALAGFMAFRTFKSGSSFSTLRNQSSNSDNSLDYALGGTLDRTSGTERRFAPGSSSALDQPYYAQPRSAVTGQHDAGSGANETTDGLNALEESLRHAAEDFPRGRTPKDEDVPVFDRGRMPPKI